MTYVYEVIYIIILVTLSLTIIKDNKKKSIEIKNYINFKNINYSFLIKMLSLSFFLRIGIEQFSTLILNYEYNEDLDKTILGIIFYFTVTCLVAPITEEIVFRFGLFKSLDKKLGPILSIIITSIVFAFIHLYPLYGFIILLVISLIWTYSFYKTNNLVYPIIMHFIHNLYALLTNYFVINNIYYVIICILCIAIWVIFEFKKESKI